MANDWAASRCGCRPAIRCVTQNATSWLTLPTRQDWPSANARLTAELSAQVKQLSHHTHELAESRRRLITAGDAERSRLERAIARQVRPHLTPLPDRLRQLSDSGRQDAPVVDAALLAPLIESLNAALEALREITRGVFPAQLARSGLPTALGSLLARSGSAGRLVVEKPAIGRRFDPRVEAAAYFCVAEAARELGDPVLIRLTAHDQQLLLVVSGKDRGGLPIGHMRDRIEAAGGSMSIAAEADQTVVVIRTAAHTIKRREQTPGRYRSASESRPEVLEPVRAERPLGHVGRRS